MASQNEASIWVSSAPKAARNTPRSRCSSAHQQRCSNLSTSASASLIASRASEVRSARCKASAFQCQEIWQAQTEPVARSLLFPARSTEYLPLCYRKRCAPNRDKWILAPANAQNGDALRVQSNPMPSGPLRQDYAQGGPRPAAQDSARANPYISFSSFAVEIASSISALARGDLSEMPVGQGLIAQTVDDRRIEVFRMRLDASRAPDLNTMPRVFSRGLKIAQKVEYDCQSLVGTYHERWVILFLRQRINSFGNLHRCCELVVIRE